MKKSDRPIYYCDFETTCLDEDNKPFTDLSKAKTRVYLWCAVDEKGGEYFGDSIEEFFKWMDSLTPSVLYFHNLSGFDGEFILHHMLKTQKLTSKEVLENLGTLYYIKYKNCEIRDSLNILPLSIKEIGEKFCKTRRKTSIDYKVGYNHKASFEELDYCFNDVYVLKEGVETFLKIIYDIFQNNGWNKSAQAIRNALTLSAISFNAFKESSLYDKLCKCNKKSDVFVRRAYFGGFVYSKPEGIVESTNIRMDDVNSMYPFHYGRGMLPYGQPIYLINKEYEKSLEVLDYEEYAFLEKGLTKEYLDSKSKFYILSLTCKFERRKGYPAIIPAKEFKNACSYMDNSGDEWIDITCCNIDFERYLKYYDIQYVIKCAWLYQVKNDFYKTYCDALIDLKNKYESDSPERFVVKKLLNAPYGKLAMNGTRESYEYELLNNEIYKTMVGYDTNHNAFKYLPQAICITAKARATLWDRAEEIGWENVLYIDTDSIKYILDDNNKEIKHDSNVLGMWKDEGHPLLFKTIAPKKYAYFLNNTLHFVCSGFNKVQLAEHVAFLGGVKYDKEKDEDTIKCNYDTAIRLLNLFEEGFEMACLQKRKVQGGIILMDINKKIQNDRLNLTVKV